MSLEIIVSYLLKNKGLIHGKKAFQKYMYFIDAKGVPTPLNFRIHHFGPYSTELDYQTDNLELIGAIDVQKHGVGFLIFPGENIGSILNQGKDFIDEYGQMIDTVMQTLPEDPKKLELWSTTHFVASSLNEFYGGESKEEVVAEVKRIKQNKFTNDEISEAYDKLKELKYLP